MPTIPLCETKNRSIQKETTTNEHVSCMVAFCHHRHCVGGFIVFDNHLCLATTLMPDASLNAA